MSGWEAISWARPEWLWSLGLVPLTALAVVWSLRRRGRALEAFAEADVRARTQPLDVDRGLERTGERRGAHQTSLAGPRAASTGAKLER